MISAGAGDGSCVPRPAAGDLRSWCPGETIFLARNTRGGASVVVRPLKAAAQRTFRASLDSSESRELFQSLRRANFHLVCSGGRRFHPALVGPGLLRVNELSRRAGLGTCWLCEQFAPGARWPVRWGRLKPIRLIGGAAAGEAGSAARASDQRDRGDEHPQEHGVLCTLVAQLGWNALPRSLADRQLWEQMDAALRAVELPVPGGTLVSAREITWTPECADPLPVWIRAAIGRWKGAGRAECWAMAVVGEVEQEGPLLRIPMPSMSSVLGWITVEADRVSRRVLFGHRPVRGPYLAFARCHPSLGADGFEVARVVLIPVLDWGCPIPVDSAAERRLIRLLQRRRVRFLRPLEAHPAGPWPDVLLLDTRQPVMLQGGRWAEYLAANQEELIRARYAAAARSTRLRSPLLIADNLPRQADRQASWDAFLVELPSPAAQSLEFPDWALGVAELARVHREAAAPRARRRRAASGAR